MGIDLNRDVVEFSAVIDEVATEIYEKYLKGQLLEGILSGSTKVNRWISKEEARELDNLDHFWLARKSLEKQLQNQGWTMTFEMFDEPDSEGDKGVFRFTRIGV